MRNDSVTMLIDEERAVGASFPLTPAQESLWFLEQMTPGTALHNMPEGWRFSGTLDRRALQQSLEALIARHEILRTIFTAREGIPRQVILPARAFKLETVDLSASPEPEKLAKRFLNAEARRPFDLQSGPLFRIHLLHLAENEHIFLINMHHIISDAWSFGIFMKELAALYEAFVSGRPSPLLELPVQYGDFACWQRECLAGKLFEEGIAYWIKQLAGPLPQLALPLDHPRQDHPSHLGATQFFSFPKSLAERLKILSREEDATLFMTVFAAFAALLQRYTGQDEIILGSPLSGRDRVETEALIGYFITTHALRIDLSGDPTFIELVRRVREVTLSAYAHQAIPFESIVKSVQLDRHHGQQALFQAVFGLQTAFTEHWHIAGLRTSRIELETGTAKFDWTVLATETSRDLGLRFEYRADLFESDTIARAAAHFERLLEDLAVHPHKSVSQIKLLSPAEQHQLLVEWNRTTTTYERELCIHEVFEARAREHPESVALSFRGRQMTYEELNQRASALARTFQSSGIEPGAAVGTVLDRSPELVVGLLAILKAGACYVPLDPSYPPERLKFMIRDSGVSLILCDPDFDAGFALPPGTRLLTLADNLGSSCGNADLALKLSPERTAYIMYTSGSTGTPKGVAISHRAVVRLVRKTNYLAISPAETFLLLAPISFDASTFEIWGALLNGARLAIFPQGNPSLEQLGKTIERENITTLWLTAGLFHQMVDHQLPQLKQLHHLLAGGDRLSVPHVLKARQALVCGELINGYGPTENTTFSCCYRVPRNWHGGGSVPIGKPIANTRAYVLDPNLQPVPIGVSGELFLGGDGLALDYVGEPGLTGEKFVMRSIDGFGLERLYRTGDRVRWLPDGNLEFLGRLDNQLKIRGFRVESGEVETALRAFPGVREAVVAAHEPDGGSKQLVAYLIALPEHPLPPAQLRQFLEARLPSHLVPAHFLTLDRFPLTTNGKIDRRALPAPDVSKVLHGTTRTAPRTALEESLVRIWSELLNVQTLGIHDNFFHLGGHSLLATQLVSRIAKHFQVELPVRALFEAPTIAELAEVLADASQDQAPKEAPITRSKDRGAGERLLARLDQLSEGELDELLRTQI